MIEPAGVVGQARLDLAQADRAGQLAKQQRQKLALRVQPPNPPVGSMLFHQTVEDGPRNVLLKAVEYAIVVPHDIAPCSCPNAAKRLKPSRINVMRLVQLSKPDSSGPVPRIYRPPP